MKYAFSFLLLFCSMLVPEFAKACQTCTATSSYCTTYENQCVAYGQQCNGYQTVCTSYSQQCTSYSTSCTSYSLQCDQYDDQGNCISYSNVCTAYSTTCDSYQTVCDSYGQECTSYSTVCTQYDNVCTNYQSYCTQYEYAEYITITGTVRSTGNNRPLSGMTVTVKDVNSSNQSYAITDAAGRYSVRVYAYDNSSGQISVNTCVQTPDAGYTPQTPCVNTTITDSCDAPSRSADFTISPPVIGHLDAFNYGSFTGWALDPKNQNANIQVHFYEKMANGSLNYIGATTANQTRSDVNTATGFTGNHGFTWALPASLARGQHLIQAYGIAVDNRQNPVLVGSPYKYFGSTQGVAHAYVVSTDAGIEGNIRVYDSSRTILFEVTPFPGFTGGVRVALGDVNGDGVLDIITAAGPGGGPHVKVYNGVDGNIIHSFFAYGASFRGGVFVAAGDINHDGKDDIITGPDAGGGPHVRVFSGTNLQELRGFFAYGANFSGGVRVGSTDVDHDGYDDIITGAGAGGGPHVKVYSGQTGQELMSFFAYDASMNKGVYVAGGDFNGDANGDVITGTGAGTAANVRVYSKSGSTIQSLANFNPYGTGFTGGARVGGLLFNNDSKADLLTAAGPGGGPHVIAWMGNTLATLDSFFAYAGSMMKGLFISGK